MEFVTIPDLARELNISERVIRYRLLNLIAEGKLKQNDDFRRDEFKDDLHFVWKIHPFRFMTETGLKPVIASLSIDNKVANNAPPVVNRPVNTPPPVVTESPPAVTRPDNDGHSKPAETSIAREFIDVLKEQIRVKDGQLEDVRDQLKETHELNLKLTGTMLQQQQKIENLLRLTEGKTEIVTKEVQPDNNAVNENGPSANNVVNEPSATGYQTGNQEDLRQAA